LRFVVANNLSMRQASFPWLYALLSFENPKIRDLIPQSHTTVRDHLIDHYEASKLMVIQLLAQAKSEVSISFDGWKADNNMLDLLGVCAHYLDNKYNLKVVVLGLRNTDGSHSGTTIAKLIFEVLTEYKITDKLAYLAADSASNNDTTLREL
jgi:hypothetical protein